MSQKFRIELINMLTGNSQKLAVDCLSFHLSEPMLEEDEKKLKNFSECLWILCRVVKLKQMKQRKVGIKPSIIVNIHFFERIVVNPHILKHLSMVLTRYIVYDFLVIERCPKDRAIEGKQISDVFLIDDKERFHLTPCIHVHLSKYMESYPWIIYVRERTNE